MKVFCKYNKEFDSFLKKTVKYTIDRYGQYLDVTDIEEIELRDIKNFPYETDGKTYDGGRKILVTSRLYELLPSFDIRKIKNDGNFKMLINTQFHEMGHATDWKRMPNLYNAVIMHPTSEDGIASLFWVEYLAEKRSQAFSPLDYDSFCNDFAKSHWRAYKSDLGSTGHDNFTYLCKVMPYFLVRTIELDKRKHYLDIMENQLLKDFILEINEEIERLEAIPLFDDTRELGGLYDIINKYFAEFQKAYKPRMRCWPFF